MARKHSNRHKSPVVSGRAADLRTSNRRESTIRVFGPAPDRTYCPSCGGHAKTKRLVQQDRYTYYAVLADAPEVGTLVYSSHSIGGGVSKIRTNATPCPASYQPVP